MLTSIQNIPSHDVVRLGGADVRVLMMPHHHHSSRTKKRQHLPRTLFVRTLVVPHRSSYDSINHRNPVAHRRMLWSNHISVPSGLAMAMPDFASFSFKSRRLFNDKKKL
jgi:hypothetical protein